jgi:hypothetical protein
MHEHKPLSNGDLTRIAESVGMVRSHDGVLMRSIGHSGGMTAEHGFAFARAAIAEDRARQCGTKAARSAADVKLPNELGFEQWYIENAFDYARDPLGSTKCGDQRKAWHAGIAAADRRAFDENIGLREMAKHAHRALNAAAAILAAVDFDELGEQNVAEVEKRCADIACSLFSLLRGDEVDRYESSPLATDTLPLAKVGGAS